MSDRAEGEGVDADGGGEGGLCFPLPFSLSFHALTSTPWIYYHHSLEMLDRLIWCY